MDRLVGDRHRGAMGTQITTGYVQCMQKSTSGSRKVAFMYFQKEFIKMEMK